MDPSFWCCYFGSTFFFVYARILTLTQIIFLCGVTIGVLDPDWIFSTSFRSETPVLNPRVSHIFIWRWDPWIISGSSRRCFSSFRIRAFYSRGSDPFSTIKIYIFLLTLLPCVIARDQGGGGGRRRQRRWRRLRGSGGGGGGGQHPRGGRRRRGGSGRGRVRGEGRLDSKVWTPLSPPGTPLLLGWIFLFFLISCSLS